MSSVLVGISSWDFCHYFYVYVDNNFEIVTKVFNQRPIERNKKEQGLAKT